ncbi:MAG: DoxX family protein [Fluviicola sp.]
MKDKITIEGRSLLFNIGFVVLNLVGLTFVVMGYHESAGDSSTLYKSIGVILMMLSIGGLIVFRGKLMMSSVARVLVGGLFIVSGLVKANDPIGFSYKLEEYFEDGALAYRIKEWFGAPGFSLEWLMEHALLLSVIICILEIVLGVLTIIGGKIKWVAYLMMGMMLFFTFLTWHTSTCDEFAKFKDHDTYVLSDPEDAYMAEMKLEAAKVEAAKAKKHKPVKSAKTGKELHYVPQVFVVSKNKDEVVIGEWKTTQCVDDCGCFGDALKGSVGRSLTPSESLWKDIILLYLVIWIFLAQWIIKPNTRKENLIMGTGAMLVIVFFSWVFGWYYPIMFGGISILLALWSLRADHRKLGKFWGLAMLIVSLILLMISYALVYGVVDWRIILFSILATAGAIVLLFLKAKVLSGHWGSALVVTNLSFLMVIYVLMYEPIKDYRPYAIGANLKEKMSDGVDGEYDSELTYRNINTGKLKTMTQAEYMANESFWTDTNWVFEGKKRITLVEQVNASIMDFNPTVQIADMSDDERNSILVKNVLDTLISEKQTLRFMNLIYNEEEMVPMEEYVPEYYPESDYQLLDTITQTTMDPNVTEIAILDGILEAEKIVMVVSKKLKDGSWDTSVDRIKAIQKVCEKKKIPFIFICNASPTEIVKFKKDYNLNVPIFSMDEIELKIIARSNPAMLVLEKAVVKAKYPHRSIPTVETFKEKHLK